VKKEDSAVEQCTKLLVRTAVLKPKSRSSQLKAVRSIAEVASRNTGDTRLKTGVVVYPSFSIFIFYSSVAPIPSNVVVEIGVRENCP